MAAQLEVVCIAAVAENGVIGVDGGMPWHYPADLAHFKETTMGHPVVLGRRTYESIAARLGGPLPGRTNIVLTRSGLDALDVGSEAGPDDGDDGAVAVAESVDAALAAATERDETVYVAGGASVYEQFLPLADRLVITEVPESPDGDTYFPEWDCEEWIEVGRETDGSLAFVTYERR